MNVEEPQYPMNNKYNDNEQDKENYIFHDGLLDYLLHLSYKK